MIVEFPETPEEWVTMYAGGFVITSRTDRIGASMESLTTFERVGRSEPPHDRLSTLWARIRGRTVPTQPGQAFELWKVPHLQQQRPAVLQNRWPDTRPGPDPSEPGSTPLRSVCQSDSHPADGSHSGRTAMLPKVCFNACTSDLIPDDNKHYENP